MGRRPPATVCVCLLRLCYVSIISMFLARIEKLCCLLVIFLLHIFFITELKWSCIMLK